MVSGGFYNTASNTMRAGVAVLALSDGTVETVNYVDHAQHGSIRSLAKVGSKIVGTGYVNNPEIGFLFIADEGEPKVWHIDLAGNILQTKALQVHFIHVFKIE